MAALLALATAAEAAPQLPTVALPAGRSEPLLWLAPSDIPALQQKRTDAHVSADYQAVRAFVNARFPQTLSNLDDDTLARTAKGAALLHQLGETPPAGRNYRDLAAQALLAVRDRRAPNPLGSGAPELEAHYDAGRLQSMAEAYDLLRGTGLSSGTVAAMRTKIGVWADAFLADIVLSMRADNIACKSGAALVTTALAVCEDMRAAGWLQTGQGMVQRSLDAMLGDEGYWREGPHYTNYTLNNLLPAAWHVRRATGDDWITPLRPLIETAIALRTPQGRQTPYEDAVPLAFPWLELAGACASDPELAGVLRHYGESGDRDTSNFGVQQLVEATRFLMLDPAIVARAPGGSPTRFVGGTGHLHALKSGHEADALYASLVTAQDHSSLTLIDSRHNVQSPLDLTLGGFGRELLVTASGGPEITRSSQRAYYLNPRSRCTVLVNGTAPFTTDPSLVRSEARLDSRDAGGVRNRLLDVGRTEVLAYADASRVRRTLAQVDDAFYVVVDEVQGQGAVQVLLPLRGRGSAQLVRQTSDLVEATFGEAATAQLPATQLDIAAAASAALSSALRAGSYAPTFGTELTISPLELSATASELRVVSVLLPRLAQDAPLAVSRLGQGASVGMTVVAHGASAYTVLAGEEGSVSGGGAITATDAALAIAREEAGQVSAIALVAGTYADLGGGKSISLTSRGTLSLAWSGTSTLAISASADGSGGSVAITGVLARSRRVEARWDGQLLPSSYVAVSGDTVRSTIPSGAGLLELEVAGASTGGGGSVTGGSGGGGGGGCALCRHAPTSALQEALRLLPLASLLLALAALRRGRHR